MENIILNRENRIAVLTINRPAHKNALDGQTYDELYRAVETVKNDPETRVMVITGIENSFCSGIDLAYAKELAGMSRIDFLDMMKKVQATFAFEELSIPVIAAVNGYAIGNGCDLVLGADFIYAGKSAVFSMAYINVGMVPDLGGSFRLTRLVGPLAAKELILTGDRFSAEKAFQLGMVSQVVPDGQLMDSVTALAEKLARKPPIAMALAKKSINNSLSSSLSASLDFEAGSQCTCIKSRDSAEAVCAMLEQRAPEFLGD